MHPRELAPGLWRWTAAHPEWRDDGTPGGSSEWPREVGAVLYVSATAAVFIDPLIPAGEERSFWRWADTCRAGKPVHVLTTLSLHRRSRDAIVERYDAATSRARKALPAGVEGLPLKGAGETMFWLPQPRALIPGDRLISSSDGTLSVCPQSWLEYLPSAMTVARLCELLRPVLELPIEAILVSHGEPVLEDARAALAKALR